MGKGNINGKSKREMQTKRKEIMPQKHISSEKNTIEYYWKSFILDRKSRGIVKASIDDYERFYKKLCNMSNYANIKNLPIDVICDVQLRARFIESLGDVSQQTINHYLRSMRAFGNFCEGERVINDFKCPIKEVEPPLKDVYTSKEIELLLKEPDIEDFVTYRSYAIINLLLSTGARSNTILNIKLKDCDIEKGYINFNTTKAKSPFQEGLTDDCIVALRKYILRYRSFDNTEADEFLFCTIDEEQMSRNTLCTSIAKYNKAHGVNKTSLHLFRHTYAKMWIQDGGDIITLAKVLNHKELEMVKRYSNLYGTDIKKAIQCHSVLAQRKKKKGNIR